MAGTTNFDKKYIQSDAVTKAQQAVQNQKEQKPGQYQSQYQQNMTDLLGQIQNRGKFQYDINADALYQQAAQRYLQQGQQAMMDTMGQASALTGGYGNSYAQNAGQQAYQSYLQGLTDLIPQYRQMAMDQYQMEGDDLLSKYNLLASQDESEYGRYMDLLNQYYTDLDMLRNDYQNERSFDYGQFTDDRGFQYQQERDAVADAQWQAEFNEKVRQFNLLNGSVSAGGGPGKKKQSDDIQKVGDAEVDMDSVLNLGYGPINGTYLGSLVNAGAVNMKNEGGKITFSNNKQNTGKFGTLFSIRKK